MHRTHTRAQKRARALVHVRIPARRARGRSPCVGASTRHSVASSASAVSSAPVAGRGPSVRTWTTSISRPTNRVCVRAGRLSFPRDDRFIVLLFEKKKEKRIGRGNLFGIFFTKGVLGFNFGRNFSEVFYRFGEKSLRCPFPPIGGMWGRFSSPGCWSTFCGPFKVGGVFFNPGKFLY